MSPIVNHIVLHPSKNRALTEVTARHRSTVLVTLSEHDSVKQHAPSDAIQQLRFTSQQLNHLSDGHTGWEPMWVHDQVRTHTLGVEVENKHENTDQHTSRLTVGLSCV